MKIAFSVVKNIQRGGGIEKYTEELGSRLVMIGHEVSVYSMRNYGDISSMYKGMKIFSVPCIPVRQMEKLSASQAAGIRVALNNWPDIVHYHSVSPGSTAWIAKLMGKQTVIQMHGLEWKRSRWGTSGVYVHRLLEKLSLLSKSNLTAVSMVQCQHFSKNYKIPTKYIPCGVNIKRKVPAKELFQVGLEPNRYILFASRLVKDKGAHYLIPAFRKLKTDYKLVIAGDVPNEEKYKNLLLDLAENDKRIIFPGFVEGRLLEELFSNSAIYVQPSEIEGLSIALLEAMSYGLPCLVSDIPENIEAIGNCGITFKSKDIHDLSEKLSLLLDQRYPKRALAEKAIERVKTFYCWDSIAMEFDRYYRSILSK